MTGCYITTLPFEFMRAAADFEPAWAGSYHVPRATVQPEPWLRSQIWPQLDGWGSFEADDKATGAFIELLHWLRDVLLQDAVFLIAKYLGHPVFRDPLFQSPQFNAFAVKVREAAQETFEDDRATAIEKVIPEVSEKLRGLTAHQLSIEKAVERRHFEVRQDIQLLKAQIAAILGPNTEATGPASAQECTLEGNKHQDWKGTRRHPLWGDCTAAYGSTYVGGPGGGPNPDTESKTLAIRQAVVDNRPHTITSHLHILEEPRPGRTTSGSSLSRPGGNGERGCKAVPRRYPAAEKETLG